MLGACMDAGLTNTIKELEEERRTAANSLAFAKAAPLGDQIKEPKCAIDESEPMKQREGISCLKRGRCR